MLHIPWTRALPALEREKTCNVDRYDVLTGQWVQLDVMQEEHCYSDHSGVASEDGTIYIFGGFTADYQTSGTVVKVEVSGDNITFSTTTPMGLVSATSARGDAVPSTHWGVEIASATVPRVWSPCQQ